jgi:PII-like signaling protein
MIQAQIYIDKDELKGAKPLYEYILRILIEQNIQGATVFHGKLGYGAHQYLNRPNDWFSFDETPLLIIFIDEDEKVKLALKALREVYKGGFIVTNQVEKW